MKYRWIIIAALLAVGGMIQTQETASQPQPKAEDKKTTAFDALPHDAFAFVSFRFHDIWRHELAAKLRNSKSDALNEHLAEIEGHIGIKLDQIERITPYVTSNRREAVLISARKPIDPKKLLQNIEGNTAPKQYLGKTYHLTERYMALYFVGDRHFVMGSPRNLESYIDAEMQKQKNSLSPHFTAQAEKRTMFGAFDVVEFLKINGLRVPPQFQPFVSAGTATFWLDAGKKKLTGRAEAVFDSEKNAKSAVPAAKNLFTLMCNEMEKGIQFIERHELKKEKNFVQYMRDLNAVLRKAKIQQKGKKVIAAAETSIDWKLANRAVDEFVTHLQEEKERRKRTLSLKMLGIAMHTYHDIHKQLPPRAVVDKNGKPLLSWRVLLLPYVEEQALYKQFRLDEPWNSPHNYKLLSKMPKVYEPPVQKGRKSYKTHYQAVTGKGTIFEDQQKLFLGAIPDGTSNTIMLVEAKKAVHWTKPEDVEYVPGKMMPKLGGLFKGGFHALMGDGSVHFIRDNIGEKTLRLLLVRDDGMVIPENALER